MLNAVHPERSLRCRCVLDGDRAEQRWFRSSTGVSASSPPECRADARAA
ncbi:hypothetical protein [Sorangium sp. So ce1000]